MFLLIFTITFLTILTLIAVYPVRKSFRYILIYLDILVLQFFYLVFIIKTGGYSSDLNYYFLFSNALTNRIYNFSLPLYYLYYIITLARLLLPYLLLYNSIHLIVNSFVTKKKKSALAILASPLLIYALVLFPDFFYTIFRNNFVLQSWVLSIVSLTLISYCICSLVILVIEIQTTQLIWYKEKLIYLTVSCFSLCVVYLIFALMDPVTIIQDYSSVKVGPITYSFNSKISILSLILILAFITISLIVNYIAMWKFAKIEFDKNQFDLKITKTMKETKLITNGLIHGLKNHLIAEKLLAMNLVDLCKEENPEIDEIKKLSESLLQESKLALRRMDRVYTSLKDIQTHLVLDDVKSIFSDIQEFILHKYPMLPIEFQVEKGKILSDRQLFIEAIITLIENSKDAISNKKNGNIEVTVSFTKVYCLISVKDNGPGIDPKIRKKIFLPFSTSKSMQNNWGLGLCYTRQVVNKHLGEIRFESSPNTGTIFYITIPRII